MELKVVTKDIFICEEANERFWFCFPDENWGFGSVCVHKTGIFSYRNSFCDNGGILPMYKCQVNLIMGICYAYKCSATKYILGIRFCSLMCFASTIRIKFIAGDRKNSCT